MRFKRIKISTDGHRAHTVVTYEDGSHLDAALEEVSFRPGRGGRRECTVTFRDCVVEWTGVGPMPDEWAAPVEQA